ncbi:unnamed protein product [Caenorhabditis auriculariae]|uniref:Uncharacterized protein n=1 Tax=Caenorhabditis auriculariae TaxID=2777116 RepID=A0A8S1HB74_9PELO|nr:unnamed protein product [Caenorhabditis auriculariae]
MTPIDTSKLSEKDRKVYEETKALEARLIALQHRVAVNKMKLEATRNSDPTDMLQGDTARALSWMIANMSRMVDDSPMDVMDVVPLDRVVEEKVSEISGRQVYKFWFRSE